MSKCHSVLSQDHSQGVRHSFLALPFPYRTLTAARASLGNQVLPLAVKMPATCVDINEWLAVKSELLHGVPVIGILAFHLEIFLPALPYIRGPRQTEGDQDQEATVLYELLHEEERVFSHHDRRVCSRHERHMKE